MLGISGDLTIGFQIGGSHWIHNFMVCKFCSCRKDIQLLDSQLLVVFFCDGVCFKWKFNKIKEVFFISHNNGYFIP
jgi:hypothetical protein